MSDERTERDSLGDVVVPGDALYGAQTQRAIDNFRLSGLTMPWPFIRSIAMVKAEAARTNAELATVDKAIADAIAKAAERIVAGEHRDQFPIDVFQTGSGTSTNMNVNEVLAHIASDELGRDVSPNDHVNFGQSSNDVIPAAIHLSAALEVRDNLLPALEHLEKSLRDKAKSVDKIVKTGRTHLMDAMPLTLGQEIGGWAAQIQSARERVEASLPRVNQLPLGGTAVGTGVNTHPEFGDRVIRRLAARTSIPFTPAESSFQALSSQDTAVELSGQLRVSAVALMKIANDLRWMNSGPLAGLAEIKLPALQPGSSIMPGKVNPVIPEAVAMACAQVLGNDATIAIAGQSGNFQLNVMLPVIAFNLLQSITLVSESARHLADRAIRGFTVNVEQLQGPLERNPILVTALAPRIGYLRAAAIAKRAYEENRPILDVAVEETGMDRKTLERLLDPHHLTGLKPRS
jgi:fumarate hydratase class II